MRAVAGQTPAEAALLEWAAADGISISPKASQHKRNTTMILTAAADPALATAISSTVVATAAALIAVAAIAAVAGTGAPPSALLPLRPQPPPVARSAGPPSLSAGPRRPAAAGMARNAASLPAVRRRVASRDWVLQAAIGCCGLQGDVALQRGNGLRGNL